LPKLKDKPEKPNAIDTMFMTVEEAEEMSGIPKHLLYILAKTQPGFPAMKIGIRWRFHRQKFGEWFERQFQESA
jgi:hypothetical protein